MVKLFQLVLAPILIFQGKQVRKNTPRLAEAIGPRTGIQGDGEKQFRLLILGDSAAAGVGISRQSKALSGQILKCFGSRYRVEWQLIAKTGATTAWVVDHLNTMPQTRFDIVVTSLGVNDVKSGLKARLWLARQKTMVDILRTKFNVKKFIIAAVPPMQLFPALPWPLKWYLGICSKKFNGILMDWIDEQMDCELLQFNLPMDTNLMAKDGFHPGPALHTIWGKEVSKRIKHYLDHPQV